MNVYKHSGAIGTMGPIYVTAVGFIAAALLGVVYTYAAVWIPFIYITFFLTLGFGFALGLAVSYAAKAGKVRNPTVTLLFGLIFGCIGLYVAWAFDASVRVEDFDKILWNPDELMAYMQWGYENGFWTIGRGGGGNVTGIFLAIVWIIEACIIVGLATIIAPSAIGSQPFCEDSNAWTTTEEDVARLALLDEDDGLLERLLEGDITAIGDFPQADADAVAYLRLDLATCPECPNCNWLTVNVVVHGVDKEGKPTTEVTPLVEHMEIASEQVDVVRAGGRQPTPEEIAAAEQQFEPPESDEPKEDGPTTDDFNFS
jgi:hypothetical protein